MRTSHKPLSFTKEAIRKLPIPEATNPRGNAAFFYDSKVRYLAVRVSSSGARGFYYIRRTDDGPIRKVIGGFPETTIEKARQQAERWNSNPDLLVKRAQVSHAVSGRTPLGTLWELWSKNAKVRKKSFRNDERNFQKHLSHWRNRGIAKIRRVHVQDLYDDICANSGKTMANRIIALLSTLFNFARTKYEYEGPNPCSLFFKLEGKGEERRERRLLDTEVPSFFEAVRNESQHVQDLIYLLLFTGARKSNVTSITWDEIDWDRQTWTIPKEKSKNGRAYSVPMTDFVMDILKRRKDTVEGHYVFPSERKPGTPVQEFRKAWDRMRKKANLEDFRLHDLRRSLASKLADRGTSALVIDSILGHRGSEIVNIYAIPGMDPAREALDGAVHEFLTRAGMIDVQAEVVPISAS